MSRLIFILLASAFLCTYALIPLIPGDNSQYVEGINRYFWMPGKLGVPVLVDTEEPVDYSYLANRKASDNQYLLYTRNNPTTPQFLDEGNINNVTLSNYNATRPLVVIAHGWNNDENSEININITSAILNATDANVIVLDWSDIADKINYLSSAAGVPEVGQNLGNFLIWLINNIGGDWNNVHLIGHSLGAHVVGYAGRQAGGLPARITGLDPARPGFTNVSERLKSTDAIYVEVIHTDGKLLGIFNPLGDADFYPNGGTNPQPGCLLSLCSHGRSHELFASSVRTNHFVAKQCPSHDDISDLKCNGSTLNMGNNILTKRGSGVYYLKTEKEFPF